jgi:CDP-diacylglycerol--serine O-phosphatidyltransferase
MSDGFDARRAPRPRKFRRGMYLLPSIFTVGNLFCGYACVVYATRGAAGGPVSDAGLNLKVAAAYIGVAILLDSLDGSIARLTGTSSAFGLQLDSLADVVSFGLAPAILSFSWGLSDFGREGWAAGFIFVTAAAMRLARFNIQSPTQVDKRYFVGMPAPAAAGVIAATVFMWPSALMGWPQAFALAVVLVPAALMVSTIRFRSFKTINIGWAPSYVGPLLFALLLTAIVLKPEYTLLALAYGYLLSAFIGQAISRLRSRRAPPPAAA